MKLARMLAVFASITLLIALSPSPVSADDTLKTATSDTGSHTITGSYTTWQDTGMETSVSVAASDKVLVVATFEMQQTQQNTIGYFRVALNGAEEITNSGTFMRTVLRTGPTTDKGIGSIAHIFTATGSSQTYKVQHHTDSKGMTTSGTIVAIPLTTTTGGVKLPSAESQVSNVAIGSAGSWQVVTGSNTTAIVTDMGSHFYVAASIESKNDSGSAATGLWKMQYQKNGGTWTDLGYSVTRSMSTLAESGMISLVAALKEQSPGSYSFRLMHQATQTNVKTVKANLVAVGLEDGTGYFDVCSGYTAGPTTSGTSATLGTVASTSVTPYASAQLFVHAQYEMTSATTNAVNPATFDLTVSSGALDSYNQRRYVANNADLGSGASVGLTSALSTTPYTVSLRHAGDGTYAVNTLDAYVVGIVLGYATGQPPVPEWSTIALVTIGTAAIAGYVWFQRKRQTAPAVSE